VIAAALLLGCGKSADEGNENADHGNGQDSGARVGTDGDDGDGDERFGSGLFSFSCSVERWAGPDEPLRRFECTATRELPYQCDCDGARSEQTDEDCQDALAAACDIDPELEADYCAIESLGTCWPRAPGGFACGCGGSDELVERDEATCEEALLRACAEPCESERGRCEPLGSGIGYDCECDARSLRTQEVECHYALEHACEPECAHAGGECFEVLRGLECLCTGDSVLASIDYDEAGHDECDTILDDLCGSDPDAPVPCTKEGENGSGSCRVHADGSYACSCETEQGSSDGGGSGGAETCLEQLRLFCPEAFQ
jgi:hypothetical protein